MRRVKEEKDAIAGSASLASVLPQVLLVGFGIASHIAQSGPSLGRVWIGCRVLLMVFKPRRHRGRRATH